MDNEQELFGLPKVLIDFKTKGTTAIKRSARGIVVMILHNESKDEIKTYRIGDVSDIPTTGLSETNVDLIKKCLMGTPLRVLVYTLPNAEVESAQNTQATVLKLISNTKFNYICAPTAINQEQSDLVSWVKAMNGNKGKTYMAVVADQPADNEWIVNFNTNNIEVDTGNDQKGNPVYKTYTALQYTARIAGILAGLALDRSATYFKLTEVHSVEKYEDIDAKIDKGELVLFDEEDGDGVKIARACNSLTTFTTDKGESFRKIKIMEGIAMVKNDIRDTFKKYYVGKVINDYDHKLLFIAAILVYFSEIAGNVLDASAKNTVDIDEQFQRNRAILAGEKVEDMSVMDIRKYNTGDTLALAGSVKFVDAMENLKIDFTM